jgi:SAM-dependent methyltransferase
VDRREHWDRVFTTKTDDEVSWFEAVPAPSLTLLEHAGLAFDSCIVDVGGGNSRLVDRLLERGVRCVTVLDVSAAVIERTRARLGANAAIPTWIVADVAGDWTLKPVDIWHDRAVFHFLVDAQDRARYLAHLQATLKPGGAAVIATFALDGPEKCSGLPVARYSPDSLAVELGPGFALVESMPHVHRTPWGSTQSFQYSRFRRV